VVIAPQELAMMSYPWSDAEKQALTPGTPLVLVGTAYNPEDELVLFDQLSPQDAKRCIARRSDSNTAPFHFEWHWLRPMSMEWAEPSARPDSFAQLQARIRRLEKDLAGEQEKVARERRTNGEIALLVHETRQECALLKSEVHAHEDRWQRVRLLGQMLRGDKVDTGLVEHQRDYAAACLREFADVFDELVAP
jgi:hypothetical protein